MLPLMIRRTIMNVRLVLYASVMLFDIFISAISQVMLKKAAQKEYKNIIEEYMNPLVIGAYSLFVVATFMTIFAYKVVPLSMGPILECTGYVYVTIFGIKIFHEKINRRKIIALAIIFAGIFIYALS